MIDYHNVDGGSYNDGADLSAWAQYYDDDGQPYYYNSVTGASQYENPGI
jgi:hypothetical protein